jgi:hypothetical protein
MPTDEGVRTTQGTPLKQGASKQDFTAAFGAPHPEAPIQIRRRAQNATPAGSSWLAWKTPHREPGRSGGFSKSSLVNATDENGASISMQMGNPDVRGEELMYLVAIFDADGKFVRHLWLEDPAAAK